MYWKKGTNKAKLLTVPLYTQGNDLDFSLILVTEAGEDLEYAYLSVVKDDHIGKLSAKLASGSVYMSLYSLLSPNCYLGHIDAETETTIDFRISFSGDDGVIQIPVFVGHGAAIGAPVPGFEENWPDVWANDWADANVWREDW